MRYHWGCAIGHIYTHKESALCAHRNQQCSSLIENGFHEVPEDPSSNDAPGSTEAVDEAAEAIDDNTEDEDPELLLDVREEDAWGGTDVEDEINEPYENTVSDEDDVYESIDDIAVVSW